MPFTPSPTTPAASSTRPVVGAIIGTPPSTSISSMIPTNGGVGGPLPPTITTRPPLHQQTPTHLMITSPQPQPPQFYNRHPLMAANGPTYHYTNPPHAIAIPYNANMHLQLPSVTYPFQPSMSPPPPTSYHLLPPASVPSISPLSHSIAHLPPPLPSHVNHAPSEPMMIVDGYHRSYPYLYPPPSYPSAPSASGMVPPHSVGGVYHSSSMNSTAAPLPPSLMQSTSMVVPSSLTNMNHGTTTTTIGSASTGGVNDSSTPSVSTVQTNRAASPSTVANSMVTMTTTAMPPTTPLATNLSPARNKRTISQRDRSSTKKSTVQIWTPSNNLQSSPSPLSSSSSSSSLPSHLDSLVAAVPVSATVTAASTTPPIEPDIAPQPQSTRSSPTSFPAAVAAASANHARELSHNRDRNGSMGGSEESKLSQRKDSISSIQTTSTGAGSGIYATSTTAKSAVSASANASASKVSTHRSSKASTVSSSAPPVGVGVASHHPVTAVMSESRPPASAPPIISSALPVTQLQSQSHLQPPSASVSVPAPGLVSPSLGVLNPELSLHSSSSSSSSSDSDSSVSSDVVHVRRAARKRPRQAHMVTDRQRRAKIKSSIQQFKQILAQQGVFVSDQVSILYASVDLVRTVLQQLTTFSQSYDALLNELDMIQQMCHSTQPTLAETLQQRLKVYKQNRALLMTHTPTTFRVMQPLQIQPTPLTPLTLLPPPTTTTPSSSKSPQLNYPPNNNVVADNSQRPSAYNTPLLSTLPSPHVYHMPIDGSASVSSSSNLNSNYNYGVDPLMTPSYLAPSSSPQPLTLPIGHPSAHSMAPFSLPLAQPISYSVHHSTSNTSIVHATSSMNYTISNHGAGTSSSNSTEPASATITAAAAPIQVKAEVDTLPPTRQSA